MPSGKAAASKEARRRIQYVEPLSDARTMLAVFFQQPAIGPQPISAWLGAQSELCEGAGTRRNSGKRKARTD